MLSVRRSKTAQQRRKFESSGVLQKGAKGAKNATRGEHPGSAIPIHRDSELQSRPMISLHRIAVVFRQSHLTAKRIAGYGRETPRGRHRWRGSKRTLGEVFATLHHKL